MKVNIVDLSFLTAKTPTGARRIICKIPYTLIKISIELLDKRIDFR